MNPINPPFDPDADEQAALFAARLDGGSLSGPERAELEAWLAADGGRGALLSDYRELSGDLGQLLPALAAAGGACEPRGRGQPARGGWRPWWIGAAAVAAAVAVGLFWTEATRARPQTIATASAQRRSFTLADGTRVELNANTSVLVENGRAERRVRIADGEAFFVVSRDRTRPFIVETAGGSVRVTGTIFNVRTAPDSELEVTVVEGSVEVRPGDADGTLAAAPTALAAGDQLSLRAGSASVRALSAGALDDALAWRRGQIACDGMPLSEVLARFAHYNGIRVTVTPGAERKRSGGIFGIDDPKSFYEDIAQAYNVRVTPEPDGSVRVSSATEP
jgi:transmembrane sensor